jgi:hypothetical protein
MKRRTDICQIAMAMLLAALMASVCHACPTCRDAVTEGSHQAGIIRGYFWSILFMMSMPFLIFGSLTGYFYYQVKRARASQPQGTAARNVARQVAEPAADRLEEPCCR